MQKKIIVMHFDGLEILSARKPSRIRLYFSNNRFNSLFISDANIGPT